MQNRAKQNYPGLVASYDTRPGNEAGLFYNAPEPTRGNNIEQQQRILTSIDIRLKHNSSSPSVCLNRPKILALVHR